QLRVELEPEGGRMNGTATLQIEATASGEDTLELLLNRGLEVRSISDSHKRPVAFERNADTLTIPLPRPLATGDRRTLTVEFEGSLFNETKEQGFSQVSIASEGSFASWVTNWYPHLRGSGSKSKGRIAYIVPAGVTVASSGRLEEDRKD